MWRGGGKKRSCPTLSYLTSSHAPTPASASLRPHSLEGVWSTDFLQRPGVSVLSSLRCHYHRSTIVLMPPAKLPAACPQIPNIRLPASPLLWADNSPFKTRKTMRVCILLCCRWLVSLKGLLFPERKQRSSRRGGEGRWGGGCEEGREGQLRSGCTVMREQM